MGLIFPVIPDSNGTITTIYNSKITSISSHNFPADFLRIDFLEEPVTRMQQIIDVVAQGERLEGKDYTSGNLNRVI